MCVVLLFTECYNYFNRWLIANKDGTGGAKVKLTAVLQAPPPESTLMVSPQTTPTRSLTSQYVSQLRGDTTADTTAPLDCECTHTLSMVHGKTVRIKGLHGFNFRGIAFLQHACVIKVVG